jgi:hypothetical protein
MKMSLDMDGNTDSIAALTSFGSWTLRYPARLYMSGTSIGQPDT